MEYKKGDGVWIRYGGEPYKATIIDVVKGGFTVKREFMWLWYKTTFITVQGILGIAS